MTQTRAEDNDIEFRRFPFRGLGSTGHCYIKVRVRPEDFVVLCVQLPGYHGTSITNAVEIIFEALIARLKKDGIKVPKTVAKAAENTSWIEHYPGGTGPFAVDSYALVLFDSRLNPVWNYVTREEAAATCEVPKSFLKIKRNLLKG